MGGLQVWTTTPAGIRTAVESFGVVSGVTVSSRWSREGGCGPSQASWKLDADPNSSPVNLGRGCLVEVYDGPALVFSGVLSEPARGRPWEMFARGMASAADVFATRGVRVPDTAVDDAITRGWDVYRDDTLSASAFTPSPTNDQPYPYVSDLLDAWASSAALRWGVDANRVVFARADDTTPTWVYISDDAVMGVADDDYVSLVSARYVSEVAGTPPQPSVWTTLDTTTGAYAAIGTEAKARWGPKELHLDLSDVGLLTDPQAQAIVDGVLLDRCARLGYTNGFTATPLNLRHYATGAPARLPQVKAGDMVRMMTVLDTAGNLDVGLSVDVILGEVTYDEAQMSATCSPMGLVPRVFVDVVADLVRKAEAATAASVSA